MKRSYIKYFAALLLFGSNGIVASLISLSSYEIVLLRSLLGSLLLVGIFFLSGHRLTIWRNKKDLLFIALSGFAMAADWLLLFEAYAQIGVSLGMIINYCGPAIVIAFSALFLKEKVTWAKMLALIAAFAGVVLISGQAAEAGVSPLGLLYAVLSALSYSAMVIFNRMAKQVIGMENATLQLLFAFIFIAVFVGVNQGFHMNITAADWFPILWIGLINTGVSCYFYFSSIGVLPVLTVAICGYLEPLSAVLLSVIILQETLLPLQIIGSVMIIGGAVFGECYIDRKKQ